jgi:hypothetical protein
MSINLRLQRLAYPFREPSVKKEEFGPSTLKFKAITNFFTCAVMGHSNFANGKIQRALDNIFENRKKVVGHAVDIHFQFAEACALTHTRPLFVLGQKDKLGAFERALKSASAKYQDDSPLLISGLREFMIADFLSQSENHDKIELFGRLIPKTNPNIQNNTMGWLDLESGCFAMRSMNGLNRVRELFGMRPHLAMMKQRDNYPLIDLEPLPKPK